MNLLKLLKAIGLTAAFFLCLFIVFSMISLLITVAEMYPEMAEWITLVILICIFVATFYDSI